MNIKKTGLCLVVEALSLWVLSACAAQPRASATQINVATASEPVQPTPSLSQTYQTPVPTASPTNSPAATWTPLPTLTMREAQEKISSLDSDNGGCQLPCWWGISPNKTTWEEAIHFLESFTQIRQAENGSFLENGESHYTTYFEVYYDIPDETASRRILVSGQDGLVTGLTVFPPDTAQNYQLHQILRLLGEPRQIYVSAQPDTQTKQLLPARIILDYGNLGVLVSYEFPVRRSGENLEICPRSVGGRLALQDPNFQDSRALSIEDYVRMITGFEPRKLGDVSGMDISSFVETFQNPSSSACLETPASIWP
jgi:hypothetical protein